jgi:hypothetical protein
VHGFDCGQRYEAPVRPSCCEIMADHTEPPGGRCGPPLVADPPSLHPNSFASGIWKRRNSTCGDHAHHLTWAVGSLATVGLPSVCLGGGPMRSVLALHGALHKRSRAARAPPGLRSGRFKANHRLAEEAPSTTMRYPERAQNARRSPK